MLAAELALELLPIHLEELLIVVHCWHLMLLLLLLLLLLLRLGHQQNI